MIVKHSRIEQFMKYILKTMAADGMHRRGMQVFLRDNYIPELYIRGDNLLALKKDIFLLSICQRSTRNPLLQK